MRNDFQHLMQEATRLTRSGDLQGATAAIQQALLRDQAPPAAATRGLPALEDIVIDVDARQLPPTPPVPKAAGEFVSGRFGSGASGRDYKLYIPPQAGTGPRPLVVMLHGCTQNPDDFAAGTRMNAAAQAQGCFVLYPGQSRQANPQGCWNWFKHSHQQRGRGEPATLAGMTRHVMGRHQVDPKRVYVAGLSAGGAMAAILGDAYPELFAAVGVHSGLATGVARDLPSALATMNHGQAPARGKASGRPTIVFHGDADNTVHPDNGSQVIAAAVGMMEASEVQRESAAGGRQYTRKLHRAADGRVLAEEWVLHGGSHAWSGGSHRGSYTDPRGPDATAEMLRFFLEHGQR